jgi:hypothetical protein
VKYVSRWPLAIALIIWCAGCSNRSVYETMKANARQQCETIRQQGEFDRCMAKASESYDGYQRARQEATGAPALR